MSVSDPDNFDEFANHWLCGCGNYSDAYLDYGDE
jgi:hypothetical protein